MTFKFVPVNTLKKVIKVEIPGDFGKATKADFEATFKRLPVSQARDLIKQIQEKSADEDKVLRDSVVDIEGVTDGEGNEVEYSSELLSQLLEESYIRGPLLAGFMDVNYSLDKLRQKNSKG